MKSFYNLQCNGGDKMIIRYADIKDLKDIVKIYNSTIPGGMVTADTEIVTIGEKIPWFNEHNNENRPLWVVEENNNIIAWLSFQSFYGRPAYNGTVEVSIYIDEIYRGQGLGHTLLKYAIDNCNQYQVNVLLGFIFGHNIPSKKLFEKHGFQNWGVLPGVAVIDKVQRDLIIFGRKIEPTIK